VKKKKKQIKKGNLLINTSPEIKMSELIGEYASDYINMGETMEERQSYLNGACSAWNIAVLPEHLREEALRRNIAEYKRTNPGVDDADAMAKWLPPNGFTGKVHHLDAKVGGTHKMSFTNFTTGHSHFLVESISNWCRTNAFATRTNSTTRTCQGNFR
jgi:hypothetical protein